MSTEAIGTTQYGDFKGTASMDGYDGPFLQELAAKDAQLEAGYVPIGMTIYFGTPVPENKMDMPYFSVTVLATNGCKAENDGISRHARSVGRVQVKSFDTDLEMMEFFKLVKRFHIVLGIGSLKGAPMHGDNL